MGTGLPTSHYEHAIGTRRPVKKKNKKEAGVPTVFNMGDVRHPQPQRIPCFQSAELRYPNCGTRKDSSH